MVPSSTVETARTIDEQGRCLFHEHGYVKVCRLLKSSEFTDLLPDYDAAVRGDHGLYRASGEYRQGKHVHLGHPSKHIPGWETHPYMRRSLSIARQLLGPDMGFWFDQILMKPAGCLDETPWHQDAAHWVGKTAEARGLTCWIALSNATETSGCMRFIPGSHRMQTLPHRSSQDRCGIQGAIEAISEEEVTGRAVALAAGDCTFHHSRTLHSGCGNRSSDDRKGLILHFAPTTLWAELSR